VWGRGKQAWITISHCTCRVTRGSSWSGKSTSGGGQACRSGSYGGGRALGGHSWYTEYGETHWMLGEHSMMRFRDLLTWCWYCWEFYISCDHVKGVACQEGHNLQVHPLDTRTKNRHATRDDEGLYTLGNPQAMLLKPVCKAWSCHQHGECLNTRSRRRDLV